MFKNYGDWDFFEDGILVEQQSPSQFTLLRCNPVQDQEDRYEFARLDVDLDDDWMDKQALRDYAGLEPGVDNDAEMAIAATEYYSWENFGAGSGCGNFGPDHDWRSMTKEEIKKKKKNYSIDPQGLDMSWSSKARAENQEEETMSKENVEEMQPEVTGWSEADMIRVEMVNDYESYRRLEAVDQNMARKMANGTFDRSKAAKAYEPIVEDYVKRQLEEARKDNEIGPDGRFPEGMKWYQAVPPEARTYVAEALVEDQMDAIQDLKRDIIRKRDHLEVKDETLDAIFDLPDNRFPYKTSLKSFLQEMQVEEPEKYVATVYNAHLQAAAKEAPDREALTAEEKRYNAVRPTVRALQEYMDRDPDISRLSPEERRASFRTVQDLRQEMPKLYSKLRSVGKAFEKSKDNSRNQGIER